MISGESILVLSGILFGIGYVGLLRQPNIVKSVISLEIMIFASVVNFAYFCGDKSIRSGHMAILIAVTIGSLVWSVIFSIVCLCILEKRNSDICLGEKR
ncbi:MAG: NADH-quinone oxidoreductase subunit K [Holosporales bacterium]|nr:NADH-quinone oxidoreductase subunit K [Holosporales bacterium]